MKRKNPAFEHYERIYKTDAENAQRNGEPVDLEEMRKEAEKSRYEADNGPNASWMQFSKETLKEMRYRIYKTIFNIDKK